MRKIYNWQTDGWTDDDNTIEPFYKGSKKCAIGRVGGGTHCQLRTFNGSCFWRKSILGNLIDGMSKAKKTLKNSGFPHIFWNKKLRRFEEVFWELW